MYDNAVYDFEMFQEQQPKRQAQIVELPSLESRRKKKANKKLKIWVKYFSVFMISAVSVGGFLFGQVMLSEYASEISVNTTKLNEYKNRNEQLEIKLMEENSKSNSVHNKVQSNNSVERVTVLAGDKSKIS